MSQPLVSVVIPAYNAARYIRRSLESVFEQTYRPIEVIVVDDGSTDGTADVVREFGDKVILEQQPNSGGAAAPWNRAIALARGEFVALQDADDVSLPERIERQMAVFEHAPSMDAFFTRVQLMDGEGRLLPTVLDPHFPAGVSLEPVPGMSNASVLARRVFEGHLEWNFVMQNTLLGRKKAWLDVGGYDESLRRTEDYDLTLRMCAVNMRFAFVDEVLCHYRKHRAMTVALKELELLERARSVLGVLDEAERRGPDVARRAHRHVGGLCKLAADLMLGQGKSQEARREYRRAMRHFFRPIQAASWLLSWFGRPGMQLIRRLNGPDSVFDAWFPESDQDVSSED